MSVRPITILFLVTTFAMTMVRDACAESPADTVKASIQNYVKAWGTTDAGKRAEFLKTAWSEDGIYTDPSAHVEGRDALIKHIGQALSSPQFQGASLAPGSEVDIHHQVFRFQWKLNDASGNALIAGMDYGEFNDKGMITKIIGFFGPFPKLK
jgi:hypothetical protein